MADGINITVRLRDAARAAADGRRVASSVRGIGTAARGATGPAARLGTTMDRSMTLAERGVGRLASSLRYPALGLAGLGVAGVKWGLSFNAQVQSARERFRLFTNDVDGLTRGVQKIDKNSAFNFADLAEAAAQLGNSGIKDVPKTLQAAANAAAASGKGTDGLNSIVIALSQIQAKGKLSQEEINQLNEAGAPGAQKTIQKAFHLTSKEVGNLGGQGLSAQKAIQALVTAWTSGKMAVAAKRQTNTLGGQWQLFTGNAQKASGALTSGLASGLQHEVLPAANRAAEAITAILNGDGKGPQGLPGFQRSTEEKMRLVRDVIKRELGPIAHQVGVEIDHADIPGHLGRAIGQAGPALVSSAGHVGVEAAKGFIHAWLEAPGWAKLLSAVYLARKTGLNGALRGAGQKSGGLAGMAGKGGVVPVYVTNLGGMPTDPVDPTGPVDDKGKRQTRGSRAVRGLLSDAPLIGDALMLGAAGTQLGENLEDKARKTKIGKSIFDVLDWNPIRALKGHDTPTYTGPGTTGYNLARRQSMIPPQLQLPNQTIRNETVLKVDGHVLARAVQRVDDRGRARGRSQTVFDRPGGQGH